MSFSFKNIFSGLKNTDTEHVGTVVGIDIGGGAIKVAEVEETTRTIKLHTYGELQLGPYDNKPIGEVVKLEKKIRIEAITDVMREAGVTGKRGALAIPLSSSFLTVLPITASSAEELASRIPVEARKYVPLSLSDVTLDWSVLPHEEGDTANTTEVMLAAIENGALTEYREILATIGLAGEQAEIEAFSLVRSLWKQSDSSLAIIDIGARSAKIYIVRNGNLERLHRVVGGGRMVTNALATALKIDFEKAEEIKRNYTREQAEGAVIYKAMTDTIGGPLDEFKRVIANYESRIGGQIGRVVCAGGVATSPYFKEFVSDRLGRQVELANPFAKVAYPAFMEDTLREIGPVFGTALGAALRHFQINE